MVFEKNYVNQASLLSHICSAVILGKINRAKERSDHHNNLVFAAGGYFFMKELSRGSLKTLKIISHRATHFRPFLIIIMAINVYKLESLHQNERKDSRNRNPMSAHKGALNEAG